MGTQEVLILRLTWFDSKAGFQTKEIKMNKPTQGIDPHDGGSEPDEGRWHKNGEEEDEGRGPKQI